MSDDLVNHIIPGKMPSETKSMKQSVNLYKEAVRKNLKYTNDTELLFMIFTNALLLKAHTFKSAADVDEYVIGWINKNRSALSVIIKEDKMP